MKKLLAILLSVMMIVGMMVFQTVAADQEGDLNYGKDWYDISWYNTTDTVFEISTAKQLYGLAYLTHTADSHEAMEAITDGKTFKLTKDIDLNPGWNADSGTAAPVEFPGILRFCGTLDGQGHTISGLYMATVPASVLIEGESATAKIAKTATDTSTSAKTSAGDYGFICRIVNGTVKNLVMTNGLVKNGAPFIGTVSGNSVPRGTNDFYGATVENVYIDVDASRANDQNASYMGGIINACYFKYEKYDSSVRDAHIVLNNVVYAGTLSSDVKLSNGLGGIFAYPQLKRMSGSTQLYGTLKMTNCLFLGSMSGTDDTAKGALIGKNTNMGEATNYTLTNCYESATALATAMAADATLANSWKTTDKGVVPATVAEMLNAQNVVIQRSAEVANETTFSLRILQGISDLNWKSVGFRVELWDATNETWYDSVDSTVTKVYTSITAAGEDVEASEEPFESDYIYGVVINGVPASGTVKLRITPLKEMVDGKESVCYLAQARIFEIVDGVLPQAQA